MLRSWIRLGRQSPIRGSARWMSVLEVETMNPYVRKVEYAVRGKLYQAAVERAKSGDPVIYTNIGNPHALLQEPITFFRQVLALVNYPQLMEDEAAIRHFPTDVVDRAKIYRKHLPGGTGSYQDSRGNEYVRTEVAQFMSERDGHETDVEDLFLTDGASAGVARSLQVLIRGSADAVLTPTPQYPLYAATIDLYNGTNIGYYLDESHHWGLSVSELQRSLDSARVMSADVRGLVVINPGNPTGQCLTEDNMREIVRWCKKENIVLFADEVYQTNVYLPGRNFVSFRKVIMEDPEASDLECFSFHTVSKGVVGECGHRGGYFHCLNINPDVREEIYKLSSTTLCSNTSGQILVGLMSNPPKPGGPSYELYQKETQGIYDSLRRRAEMIAEAFGKMEGVHCNPVEGALYAFPQITISENAIRKAHELSLEPDVFYCLSLLEETGICTVPGSGFGQQPNTFHFRTTILPQEKDFNYLIDNFTKFHAGFMDKYR